LCNYIFTQKILKKMPHFAFELKYTNMKRDVWRLRRMIVDKDSTNAASFPPAAESAPAQADEALALQYQAKKTPSALATLVKRHQNGAYRAALAITRNSALAEEAVQEAFLQMAQGRSKFMTRGHGSFRSWFYCVVGNQAKMLLRRERGDRRRATGEKYRRHSEELVAEKNAAAFTVLKTEEVETSHALNAAVYSLRDEMREPIVLHFLNGLTQEEVGRVMGLSRKEVQRRMSLGLELLRKRLAQSGITTSLSALPALLASAQPTTVPATLAAALERLVANPSAFAPAATASQSVRTAGLFSSQKIGLAAIGLTLCATTGVLWQLNSAGPTATNTVEASRSSPENANATENESSEFYRRWTFENGPAADLELLDGAWHWQRGKDGIGRMIFDDGKSTMTTVPNVERKQFKTRQAPIASFKPSVKTPAKPFCVRMKVRLPPANQSCGLGVCWVAGKVEMDRVIRVVSASPAREESSNAVYQAIFIGRYSYLVCDAGGASLAIYAKEYPTNEIGCTFMYLHLEELELRELTPQEIKAWEKIIRQEVLKVKTKVPIAADDGEKGARKP
jgi:RNA polymerase sigma factor (sigma-70 family)